MTSVVVAHKIDLPRLLANHCFIEHAPQILARHGVWRGLEASAEIDMSMELWDRRGTWDGHQGLVTRP